METKRRSRKDWGWCLPTCENKTTQKEWKERAHEAVVDSFVYEDCSKDIDIKTEFCTGAPITSSYGQEWMYSENGESQDFVFVKHVLRDTIQYQPKEYFYDGIF